MTYLDFIIDNGGRRINSLYTLVNHPQLIWSIHGIHEWTPTPTKSLAHLRANLVLGIYRLSKNFKISLWNDGGTWKRQMKKQDGFEMRDFEKWKYMIAQL